MRTRRLPTQWSSSLAERPPAAIRGVGAQFDPIRVTTDSCKTIPVTNEPNTERGRRFKIYVGASALRLDPAAALSSGPTTTSLR